MTLLTSNSNMSLIILLMRNAATHTSPPGYAAFISYRHLPRDAEVACEVQRAIEEYRLPRHVVQTRQAFRSPKLGKCFRDEDELAASHSLPDSIQEALAASRTLIVICSPETRESSWVRREIEMFEQLHGRECVRYA